MPDPKQSESDLHHIDGLEGATPPAACVTKVVRNNTPAQSPHGVTCTRPLRDTRHTFETNVFGTVRVLHAFLPLLERSEAPAVVNVSSGLASLTRLTTLGGPSYVYPGVAYQASKTAVNVITVQYAKGFPNMRINAVEPGFTRTDLNGNTGVQTVEQGAEIIVRMAQVDPDGPHGRLLRRRGRPSLVRPHQAPSPRGRRARTPSQTSARRQDRVRAVGHSHTCAQGPVKTPGLTAQRGQQAVRRLFHWRGARSGLSGI
ncbi:hypothetical protein GCM10010193_62550 [Kitasatospora atroaurantiaca]